MNHFRYNHYICKSLECGYEGVIDIIKIELGKDNILKYKIMQSREYKTLLLLVFLVSLVLFSCTDKEVVRPNVEDKTANEWIAEKMRDVYLWNDEIAADNRLNYSWESEDFFYELLSDEDGYYSRDGDGNKTGNHYPFSSIEKKKNLSKSFMGDTYSFGFEFLYCYFTDMKKYMLQALYVVPGSPADKAGLKRGEWIVSINGGAVSSSGGEISSLLYPSTGSAIKFGIAEYPDKDPRAVVDLTADIVKDDPVFAYNTFDKEGKKIGYLLYNHFTAGPEDNGQDETYNNSLRKAFAQFGTDLDEFILDLRYNGGGYLSCAQLLATMLAPSSAMKDKAMFCKTTDNKGKSIEYRFDETLMKSGTHGANLDLKRLYVITSSRTASASEAIINGLSPYYPVIIVGEHTVGKNVGSIAYKDDKQDWILHPITSKLSNSEGFSDYSEGFSPTFKCNESRQFTMSDLGDENEFILSQVLNYILYNTEIKTKSSSAIRSSGAEPEVIYNSLDRRRTNAVLLPSEH